MNQKYLFVYSLILTVLVFNIGIFLGYMLEASRVNKINSMYIETETEVLDQITQKEALNLLDFECESLFEENLKFGEKIFEEAQIIQRYEDANRINNDIQFQHKRFDVLRALFWMNSIRIKNDCNLNYHNVIYLYDYNNPTIEQESKQKFFSNLLKEIKEKFGKDIILIPLSGDNEISSINLLIEKYNITQLPAILIDEKNIIYDVENKEDIEKYLV